MKKVKNILILAGGDSTRFWPLHEKVLFSFLGKSLIEYIFDLVEPLGEKIIVVASTNNSKAIKELRPRATILVQKDLDGMAGAVLSCKNDLKGDVLILNGNDLFSKTILLKLLDEVLAKDLDFAFVAKKMNSYFPGGYLSFDPEGKLSGIIEKPDPTRLPSDLVNLVIDYFKNSAQLIQILADVHSGKDDLFEIALTEFIKKYKTHYVAYDNFWHTVKYPWQVLPMMNHFLSGLGEEIRLGKNVKIAQTAKVVGPCFIGDNTIIGDFAIVRQSHIGNNCIIGGYSEVTRSYLGNNVSLHRNYVGDSVLDNSVLLGAEATTANFRFDGKAVKSVVSGKKIDTQLLKFGSIIGAYSKIGVNTTLLPGGKIGSHTLVAPGYTIAEDIGDNLFVRKQTVKNKHVDSLTRNTQ